MKKGNISLSGIWHSILGWPLALLTAFLLLGGSMAGAAPQQPSEPQQLAQPTKYAPGEQLSPGAKRVYQEVLKLRIETARTLLRDEQQRAPNAAGTLLVADYVDFMELLGSQDAGRYDAVMEAQDERLEALEKSKEEGPLREFARAEIQMHQAVAQIVFAHQVQGAWSMRHAYQRLQTTAKHYPNFLPARKTLGMCQFFIGLLPEGYRWFLRLLGMPGSVQNGLQNLRSAAQQPNDFKPEAEVLLAVVQEMYYRMYYKKLEETAQQAAQLAAQQPDNLLYSLVVVSLNKKLHHTEEALDMYRMRPTGPAYLSVPYLHHIAADLFLYKGLYTASIRENQLFLQQSRGPHYRKDAAFKMYLAAWLGGDKVAAERYRKQIDKEESGSAEEDAYAQRFYDDNLTLNRTLTRARLQIDGGYYREALGTLRGFSVTKATPLNDRLEELYRRARAYHGLHLTDSARLHYARTIALAGDAPYAYAPQSALQLAYLYQASGELNLARTYFQKTLAYPDHEYKNSTDAKAKLGLSSLKQAQLAAAKSN